MHFSYAIISSVLLAINTALAHHPFRHSHLDVVSHRGGRQLRLNRREARSYNTDDFAGAILQLNDGTFSYATGIFTAPNISGSTSSSASAWVGIDSVDGSGPFQAGIDFVVTADGPQYSAWFEWYPAESIYPNQNIEISAGDRIQVTLAATNSTSGIATIKNLNNAQHLSRTLANPSAPMKGQRAEWLVEDYTDQSGLSVHLANFGTVTFTDCHATTTENGFYTPADADIQNMEKSGQVITSVSIHGSSMTVRHV